VVLVDASIWIDHLRGGDARLGELLVTGQVLAHAFVTGELALGNLERRNEVLGLLSNLPRATVADDRELLHFHRGQHSGGIENRLHRRPPPGFREVDAARLPMDARQTPARRLHALGVVDVGLVDRSGQRSPGGDCQRVWRAMHHLSF